MFECSIIEIFISIYNVLYPYYDSMPNDFVFDLGHLQQYYDDSEEDEKRNEWTEEMEEEWDNLNKVSVSAFHNLSLRIRSQV